MNNFPMRTASAEFSPDLLHRFELRRTWDPRRPPLTFCMLNPSTADAALDDPTIRKCVGFARRVECGGIVVVNAFSYRATNPFDLLQLRAEERNAPASDGWLLKAGLRAEKDGMPVIVAWGANMMRSALTKRAYEVKALFRDNGIRMRALKLGKNAIPSHPLMLPYELVRGGAYSLPEVA